MADNIIHGAYGIRDISELIASAVEGSEGPAYLCLIVPNFKGLWELLEDKHDAATISTYIVEVLGRTTPSLEDANRVRAYIVRNLRVSAAMRGDVDELEQVIQAGVDHVCCGQKEQGNE